MPSANDSNIAVLLVDYRPAGSDDLHAFLDSQPDAKVVMVSSALSPDNLILALEAGVHGYVVAEAGNQAVMNAVRVAPAGATYLSSEATDTLVAQFMRRNRVGDTGNPFARLSKREREVCKRLVNGETTASIALELVLSPKTVDTYRRATDAHQLASHETD